YKIFAYPHWNEVLEAFSLKPAPLDVANLLAAAASRGMGGGESESHRKLKLRIAGDPKLVGLAGSAGPGLVEHALPSGDKLDVLFRLGNERIAVEVKSEISDDADLVRGMFQCVKYQAVLEAVLQSKNESANVRTLLATAKPLPEVLIPLKN